MNQKDIVSFSLEQMREIAGDDYDDIRYESCVFAERDSSEIHSRIIETLRFPCRVDAYLILIGMHGSVTVSCNLNRYELKKNTIFVKTPNDIVQVGDTDDFRCVAVAFDENFIRKLQIDFRNMVSLFLSIQKSPCIEITEDQLCDLQRIVAAAIGEIRNPDSGPYSDEVIRCLIRCGLYKMCNIVSNYVECLPAAPQSAKSRNEAYFQSFMEVLGQHYKTQRTVGFYASQLCITPKYLTTLIKRVSGKSAAQWIDEYVVLEAKNLLRYSNLSVQEIAYHLNFSNQSFFGKYFKHQTGMSPSAYKMQK